MYSIYKITSIIILGFVCGTIINVLADVLPPLYSINRQPKRYRPTCPGCNEPYPFFDYLILRRCRTCNSRPAVRRFIVPGCFIAVLFYFQMVPNERLNFLLAVLLWLYFGAVLVMDIEHRIILDPVTIGGEIIALAAGWQLHGLQTTLIGGAAGFAIMLVLYYLGILFAKQVSKARGEMIDEPALGAGDVRLGGVLGLLLGWPGITLGLLIAIILGGIISLVVILVYVARKQYHSLIAIPYAPFLIMGAVILLFKP